MKRIFPLLSLLILGVYSVLANDNCFIVKEKDIIIRSEGNCDTRYSPGSSFKIALALMGFDSGILKDETHPMWPFKPEYKAFLESWKDDQNPKSWIRNSCVWYSQILTSKLGLKKFQEYVKILEYGNQDVSGDKKLNNGLTHAWLSSSLEISPKEQIVFLEKLLFGQLHISEYAQSMTKKVMYIEDLSHGWKLYGKTGSGFLLNKHRMKKLDIKHGWFMGWIEKGDQKIIFVNHIIDSKKEKEHAGPTAKEQVKEKLHPLIQQIEDLNKN